MTKALPLVRPAAIPGPSGHPLLGMGPAFGHDILGTLLVGFRQHGDLVAYRFGPQWGPLRLRRDAVAVHHPDGIHQVLTNRRVFVRGSRSFEALTEMIGTGLVTSEGEVWLRQRRTLQPLFTPVRVARYAALMATEAARIAADPALKFGSVVDLHALMQRYTLCVVGRVLFGDDVDDLVPELHRLMPLMTDLTLARALQAVRLPLTWPTPRNRRFSRVRAAQYGIVDQILDRRASRRAQDRDDLISRLHAARDSQTDQVLSAQEIRDQALVFLIAGHETTAGALTFTLHQLGRNPRIQDRVAAASGVPGDGDLVRAAVFEGMRLFPPSYGISRRASADTEIAGHAVPAGTTVIISPWVTHRHPDFWPEPERYDPDRFLGDTSRPRYAYFPFGGGPHTCIGEQFALQEATVLLRALLTRYRVESLDADLRLAPLLTLRPAAPVLVTLNRR